MKATPIRGIRDTLVLAPALSMGLLSGDPVSIVHAVGHGCTGEYRAFAGHITPVQAFAETCASVLDNAKV